MKTKRNIKKDIRRVGDIALRNIDNDDFSYEIVKYYPNSYYGNESKFIVSKKNPDFYIHPEFEFCTIHKDCFKNPECCYVVAWVTNEEEADILSVGLRPWELEGDDEKNFKELIKWAMEHPQADDNYEEEGCDE